jgi:hypothetical protein
VRRNTYKVPNPEAREMKLSKRAAVLLVLAMVFVLVDCGDDDSPVGPASSTYFSLGMFMYESDNALGAMFSTTDQSVIPLVVVNGVPIDEWIPYGSTMVGVTNESIPYSSTVEFSITARGKTSTGTVDIPPTPSNLRCNGQVLLKYDTVPVPESDTYAFTWLSDASDYSQYRLSINLENELLESLSGNTTDDVLDVTPPLCDRISFSLRNWNGLLPESGAVLTSVFDYGNGFVFAVSPEWGGWIEVITAEAGREVADGLGMGEEPSLEAGGGFPFTPGGFARRLEEAVASQP